MLLYDKIIQSVKTGTPLLALLLDPDKCKNPDSIVKLANKTAVAMILVGGSEVHADTGSFIDEVKRNTNLEVVLFPGDVSQFTPNADAILLLSLISGRNPEYLISQHVSVAQLIKSSKLEVIPTGYMLIDGGCSTSVQRVSQTTPIAASDIETAVSTAIAGEMLGLKLIYLEAGSGAKNSVPLDMISAVRKNVNVPLVVGGGIRTVEQFKKVVSAGANVVVVGNSIENNPSFLAELSQ